MRNTSICSFQCIAVSLTLTSKNIHYNNTHNNTTTTTKTKKKKYIETLSSSSLSKKRFLNDKQNYLNTFMIYQFVRYCNSVLLLLLCSNSCCSNVQSFIIQSTNRNKSTSTGISFILQKNNKKFQPTISTQTTSFFSLSLSLSSTTKMLSTTARQNLLFNQIRKTTTSTTTAIQLRQQQQQQRKQSASFIFYTNNNILTSNTKLQLLSSNIEDSWTLLGRKSNNQRQRRIENISFSTKSPTLNDNNNNGVEFNDASTSTSTSTSSYNNEEQEESINQKASNVGAPKRFLNFPFSYHEEIIIRIESISNRGYGIGRVEIPQSSIVSASGAPINDNDSANDDDDDDDDSSTNTDIDVSLLEDTDDNEVVSTSSSTSVNNNNRKWVVMVPNVIENELVRVRIFRNYNNYSEGDLIEVIEQSIYRTNAKCIYYNECGGCQFQHVQIQEQRNWKTKFVLDALQQYNITNHLVHTNNNNKNNNNIVQVNDCIGTNEIYNYRTKITPHYQAPITLSRQQKRNNHKINQLSKKDIDTTTSTSTSTTTTAPVLVPSKTIDAIGFQKRTSRTLVDIEYCAIATEEINNKYNTVRTELLSQPSTRTKGATLLFRQDDIVSSTTGSNTTTSDTNTAPIVPYVTTNNNEYITTTVNNIKFTYKAGNFFQNNYYVLPIMVNHVIHHATKPAIVSTKSSSLSSETSSSLSITETIQVPMTHLVDCYCGSGLFALSLAKYFNTVIGIEINDNAVQEAIINSKQNNITNCQFVSSNALNIFNSIQDTYPKNTTVVIIDPPRKGCTTEFLNQLYQFNPYRIVYMSCDPITQCRDAADIINTGLYTITSIQPFDLFPQTRHIECLIIFDKKIQ